MISAGWAWAGAQAARRMAGEKWFSAERLSVEQEWGYTESC